MAGPDPRAAAGLTQILARHRDTCSWACTSTCAASSRITRGIARRQREAQAARVAALLQRPPARRRPLRPEQGARRHRPLPARSRSGTSPREDLAFESYHMGIGNLQHVISRLRRRRRRRPTPSSTSTARPTRHAAAYAKLVSLRRRLGQLLVRDARAAQGDHAPGARRPGRSSAPGRRCRRTKNSAEDGAAPARADDGVRQPPPTSGAPGTATSLVPLAADAARARAAAWTRSMGELARQAGTKPGGLYRGLRPEALACCAYIGAQRARVRRPHGPADRHGDRARRRYQRCCSAPNSEATRGLLAPHRPAGRSTSQRRYRSPRQALRVPVHARPAAVAQPDRVGARARARSTSPSRATPAALAPAAAIAWFGAPVTDAIRTPDELLEGLPDFPFDAALPAGRAGCGSRTSTRATARRWCSSTASRRGRSCGARCIPRRARRRPPLHRARPRRLRPLGQADGHRLVLVRPPRRGRRVAARGPRHPRRDVRRPRLGRPDRPAARRRAPRAGRPAGRAWTPGCSPAISG